MNRRNPSSGEYVRLWSPSAVEGVELISSCLLSYCYGKHFHEEYTIGINDRGVGSFWCRGAFQIAGPKSLNLIAPGEVHTGAAASREGWTYRGIYVTPSKLEEISRQFNWRPGGLPRFRQSIVMDDQVWCGFDQVFRILSSRHSRLESDTTLLTALRLLFERFTDRHPPERRNAQNSTAVAKARKHLEDRYSDDISLDELAAVGGVSPHYLIRCFQRELGLPPHAYQLQIRLQRAKADVKSDASISQIAIRHGFFDQSHLHRHFQRSFGITPGQYREGNFVQDR